MKLDNTVIKVKNQKHGKEVLKWFLEQGVSIPSHFLDPGYYFSTATLRDTFIYYGVVNDKFDNFSSSLVKSHDLEIIELPKSISEPELTVIL
jgi:hypothetical protein